MESKRSLTKLFYILPIGIILNMILGWKYTSYYTPDSHAYISFAQDLPKIKITFFPLLYPFVLKVINFIFHDYDTTAKFLNILLITSAFTFVKVKDFYWREIWMLFTFSSLQSIYPMVWSENLLLILIIFYSYCNYKFIKDEINPIKFLILSSLLLLLMFTTKYNSLFFLAANFIFTMQLFAVNKKEKSISYFLSLLFSIILFCSYLIFNYFIGGSAAGKRGFPAGFNYSQYFYESLKNVPLSYDPFSLSIQKICVKFNTLYNIKFITIVPYIISFLIFIMLFFKLRKLKNKKVDLTTYFFFITSFVFLLLTFVSSYFTIIDVLNYRLLINFYIFLIIGIIDFININKIYFREKYILCLGVLSLILYTINLIIVNYL